MDIKTVSNGASNKFSLDWGRAVGEQVSRPFHSYDPCNGIRTSFKVVNDIGLAVESGLHTAVLISLFSDRRADKSADIDPKSNPRGWCGEEHVLEQNDHWGSHLWLGYTTKSTEQWRGFMIFAAQEALQWLIDKSFVSRVDVSADWANSECLKLNIEFYKNDADIAPIYSAVWALTFEGDV